MSEICKTELFGTINVRCFLDYKDDGYDYVLDVVSTNKAQANWGRSIYFTKHVPSSSDYNYIFQIHYKVVKHIRKKVLKRTRRLLRKAPYRNRYEAQNGICYLCNEKMSVYDCTVDHVTPRARGGKNTIKNMLLTHCLCNNEKADRMPTTAELAYLQDINDKAKRINYIQYHP